MQVSSYPTLDHLDRMTDSTGLIQHAIHSVPRRDSGYTTDDNARALRLCSRLCDSHADGHMLDRVARYLSFIEHAQCADGSFHNFMSYQREWLDKSGCGDSQGQTVLALAEVLGCKLPRGLCDLARELIARSLPRLDELIDLRAHAYVVQAWTILRRAGIPPIDGLERIARHAADQLVVAWQHSQHMDWQWFEPQMTYANAVLPHAMFDAAECWPDEAFLNIAESSFRFLDQETTTNNVFWPIGNDGWSPQHEVRALYDQQPVEASTMAAAAISGLRSGHGQDYRDAFQKAHGWFHGQNSLRYLMADFESGGCLDGLESTGVNRNRGAESTLAYLWTELLARELQRDSMATNESSVVDQQLKLNREFAVR